MKRLLSLLVSVIFSFTGLIVKAQVNTQDSLALVDLFQSTDGSNWKKNTNWLTNAPVRKWYGITLDRYERVYKIMLGKTIFLAHSPLQLVTYQA